MRALLVPFLALLLSLPAAAQSDATETELIPREEFIGLIRDHPAILAGLYLVAVERDEETTNVLGETTAIAEDFDLV